MAKGQIDPVLKPHQANHHSLAALAGHQESQLDERRFSDGLEGDVNALAACQRTNRRNCIFRGGVHCRRCPETAGQFQPGRVDLDRDDIDGPGDPRALDR